MAVAAFSAEGAALRLRPALCPLCLEEHRAVGALGAVPGAVPEETLVRALGRCRGQEWGRPRSEVCAGPTELNGADLKDCVSNHSLSSNASLPSVQSCRRLRERRVASWAVSFERLLQDPLGVRYFSVSRTGPAQHPSLVKARRAAPWAGPAAQGVWAPCQRLPRGGSFPYSGFGMSGLGQTMARAQPRSEREVGKVKSSPRGGGPREYGPTSPSAGGSSLTMFF